MARLNPPERVCCGNSRKTKIKDNDILGLHLMWTPENRGIMKFTINGVNVPGDISGMLFAALLVCAYACAGVCVCKFALVRVATETNCTLVNFRWKLRMYPFHVADKCKSWGVSQRT